MRLKLPSSRTKHYLSGMDWVIHALDESSRKKTGSGNAFLIAVELSGEFNPGELKDSFCRYGLRFPHLQGKVSRDFNLAPYWRLRKNSPAPEFSLNIEEAARIEDAFNLFESELNKPFEEGALPVKALAIHTGLKWILGFVFDHRFFDARGAEFFLRDFQIHYLSGGKSGEVIIPPGSSHLDRWSEQFEAGKKVNRARRAREKNSNFLFLKSGESVEGAVNRFKVRTFTEAQTLEIFSRAEKQAGAFMFLPYSLACGIHAMRSLFLEKGRGQGDFVIPVTRDMRANDDGISSSLLFNHFSFLFFHVKSEESDDFEKLLAMLKNQLYEQVKHKMPEALAEASMLMRILPRSLLSRGLQMKKNNPAASFSFAVLGESAYSADRFMKTPIENMIHMPRVPVFPGLGIFFSQYKKRLNITLSYLDSLLREEEAARLLKGLSL